MLQTAVAREVFAALVWAGDHEDDDDHWATKWSRFATQVLGTQDVPDPEEVSEDELREWIDDAVRRFAERQRLTTGLTDHIRLELERQSLEEEIN